MSTRRAYFLITLVLLAVTLILLPACSSPQSDQKASPQTSAASEQTSAETGTNGSQDTDQNSNKQSKSLLDEEEIDYAVSTKNFIPVTIDEVNQKIANGDTFYLYLGRETCVWCRMIAPHYQKAFDNAHTDLYYLDSTDSKENPPLQKFRDNLGLDTVPQLIAFSKGNHQVLDISTDSKQIDKDIVDAMNSSIAAHPNGK